MNKCSVYQIANLVGKKWTISLMQQIELHGKEGFNSIQRRMYKISPKILSKRLTELEEKKLIKKTVINAPVKKTSYILSKKGIELQELMDALKKWNMKYDEKLGCEKKECVNCSLY